MKWYFSLSYIKLNVLHLGSVPRIFQAFESKKNSENSNHILHTIFSACGDHIFRQTSFPYKNRTPILVIDKYSGIQYWLYYIAYILYTVRRLLNVALNIIYSIHRLWKYDWRQSTSFDILDIETKMPNTNSISILWPPEVR